MTVALSAAIRELDERFAANLMRLRIARRLSRRALAERSGVPAFTLENIENGRAARSPRGVRRGRRPASIGEAVSLAHALGVAPAELLRDGGR